MTPILLHAAFFNYSNVGLDSQLELLKNEILDNSKTYPPSEFSNSGCWRGTQQLENIRFLLDAIEYAVNEQLEYYARIDPTFAEFSKKDFNIHYWANVNEPGSRNVMHAHKPGIFSGVYYLQGERAGDLRLLNPANTLGECNPESPFVRDFFFSPKNKDLIMWPSWMPHEVEANLSNRQRINIAFDVRFNI